MARSLVFDATAADFADSWQRLDLQLLQNSSVHRCWSDSELDDTTAILAGLGYAVHRLDASRWQHADDMHSALAAELDFPGYYGRNLDALHDVLGDVAYFSYGSDPGTTGTVLALAGYESFAQGQPRLAHVLLDIFAHCARSGLLVGHPMLCLVSAQSDFPPVGACAVLPSPAPPGLRWRGTAQPGEAEDGSQQ